MQIQWTGAVEYTDCIPTTNMCPGYNTKQSDGEISVPELERMWSTTSLPLLPGRLRVLATNWVLSMDQIEPFDISTESKIRIYAKLNC